MLLLSKFKISGHSMEPKLKDGDKILASFIPYLFKTPKNGDVIVFKDKSKVSVKRIKKIEKEKYFVEGDNKKDSLDSKSFGEVTKSQILGKLILKL